MKGDGEWEMAYYVCDLYGSRTPFSHLATWPPNQRPSVVTTQWQTTVLPSLSLCLCLCLFLCLSLSLTLSLLLPPGFLPPLLCFLYVISFSLRLLYSAFICFFPLALLSLSPLPSSPLFLLPLIYCNSSYFPFVFLFLILLSLLEDNPVL